MSYLTLAYRRKLHPRRVLAVCVVLALFVTCRHDARADEYGSDISLTPYFETAETAKDVEDLPLLSSEAAISVVGTTSEVTVTQRYENSGEVPIEARYVFPASTRAAVRKLTVTIGERRIEARIEKRKEARAAYETARRHGTRAALLEQHRPNVFEMNVANIMPGETIDVELVYSELLVPQDGEYTITYPTVVGPRYSNALTAPGERGGWIGNPYLPKENGGAAHHTDIVVRLATGVPLLSLRSPTHSVRPVFHDESHAEVRLDGERSAGTRDFELKYKLRGAAIQTGVLRYAGENGDYVLAMVQPPARSAESEIVPREIIFVVDVSGSMNGFPIETAKVLMTNLLESLRPIDRFNVILFAGGNSMLFPQGSESATPDKVRRAAVFVESAQTGGGTELIPALGRALSITAPEGVSRTIAVITDGLVSVEREGYKIVRESLGDANLFTFGIGTSVNRALLEGLARAGRAEPFVVTSASEAPAAAEKFSEYLRAPLLTDISVTFEGTPLHDIEPVKQPDLMANRPLVILGRLPRGASSRIVISGRTARGEFTTTLECPAESASRTSTALRALWARERIQRLDDDYSLFPALETRNQIERLGLEHSLLTQFTSFIAVDTAAANIRNAPLHSVSHPIPLPDGVTSSAVSGSTGTAQPPSPRQFGGHIGGGSARVIRYNDGRVTESVDGVLTYLEGSFGALAMLVFAGACLILVCLKRYKSGSVAGVLALCMFTLRSLMATFFNDQSILK